jgi:type IV pilus assembly protein PilY1
MVGVSTGTERDTLINGVLGTGMGDIIHSEPAVEIYAGADGIYATADDKTLIFVGANDGMLHCFDDADGSELWGFIPPSQLNRLPLLNNADHDYFVDGSPSIFTAGSRKVLVIGERRGGSSYTAIDVTDYAAPEYLYTIDERILDPDPSNSPDSDTYELLGQSWSRPVRGTVVTASSVSIDSMSCNVNVTSATQDVFFFAGGYDTNQDSDTPVSTDSVGRAVFAVDAATGSPINGLSISPASHSGLNMTHSIVDIIAFDPEGDGTTNRLYFTDLGGNVYAFRDDQEVTYSVCGGDVAVNVCDGSWNGRKLFSASADDGVQRKLMYAPDVTLQTDGDFVFFGTGDRTDPDETGVVNRFYAVKNDWTGTTTLTESDLVDVTDNLIQLGTDIEKQNVETALENSKGWFIRFDENAGEKVVATPRVFGGIVYFTTYTPSSGSGGSPGDPCVASTVRGVARLYALDFETGASVVEWSDETELDNDGNAVDLGRKDRCLAIGTAIPSASVIAVLKCGARGYSGLEGGIFAFPAAITQDMHRYFWNQMSD